MQRRCARGASLVARTKCALPASCSWPWRPRAMRMRRAGEWAYTDPPCCAAALADDARRPSGIARSLRAPQTTGAVSAPAAMLTIPPPAGRTDACGGRRTSSAQMTPPGRPPPPSPPPARLGARTVRTAPCGRRGPRRARAGRRAAPPARRRAARPLPLRGSECAQPVGAEDRVRFLVPGGRVDGLEDVHTANAAFQEHIQ